MSTIKLTDTAIKRIEEICTESEFVRISLTSGGCHGFSYKFDVDTVMDESDIVMKNSAGRIIAVIKDIFLQKLEKTVLDFKKTISASYFVLESDNFETTCGCGTSFSLKQ